MIDFLNSVKSLIKVEKVHTDNNVFKLHYKFTVIMLIVFSILLTSKQYFGEPIACDVGSKVDNMKEIVELFCWIHGTYTVARTLNESVLPGITNEYTESTWDKQWTNYFNQFKSVQKDKIIWQKYYQWVCILFCFQALLFYIPRYIWKTWEGGRMRLLTEDLRGPLVTPNWNHESKSKLVKYLMSGRNSHTLYSIRYTFCEMLNLINVLFQIYLLDWFLMGKFSFYGLAFSEENLTIMDEVFPKLTKCKYYNYGQSGSVQIVDALCILPLNILNEKLFLILWFWLHLLSCLTFLAMVYRFIVICSKTFRTYLLIGHSRYIGRKQAAQVIREMPYGDFFILHNVGNNVNPFIFQELIAGIQDYMKSHSIIYRAHNPGLMDL